jgi:hypothetical protein
MLLNALSARLRIIFIAGLCSLDKDFPVQLWDHLVPHAFISFGSIPKFLRGLPSTEISISIGHRWLHPEFAFSFTKKPAQRDSWSPHVVDG